MKRTMGVISLMAAGIVLFSSLTSAVLKSSGPPACNAGEPPNNTNCTGCHTDHAVNSGTGILSLDLGGAAEGYEPGKTYSVKVSLAQEQMAVAGFQLIALQDNDINTSPGVITLTQPGRTQVIDKNNPHPGGCATADRVWVEHTYQGISLDSAEKNSWQFEWQAPASGVGNITFYVAGVGADHDLTEQGDFVYTGKTTISELVGVKQPGSKVYSIYPNPARSELAVSFERGVEEVVLYTVEGRQMVRIPCNGAREVKVPLKGLKSGLYLIQVVSNGQSWVEKVWVNPSE